MKREIEIDDFNWMLEVEPELYDDNPRRFQIRNKDYGLYTKKEAELICDFIRMNGKKMIYDVIIKQAIR